MLKIESIKDVVVTNKIVFLRVDYNVPINTKGEIVDFGRIEATKETISYLIRNNAKIVICSHFGRPQGIEEKFSLKFLVEPISRIMGVKVSFSSEVQGEKRDKMLNQTGYGEILLLENIRFWSEEKKGDEVFARAIAENMNIYVNEAFACSHRRHASIYSITKYIRSVAGFNFKKEIDSIDQIKNYSNITAVIGGAKISTKINVISSLTKVCNHIILGGALANNFIQYQGLQIGKSMKEEGCHGIIEKIYDEAKNNQCKIIIPVDCIVCKNLNFEEQTADNVREKELGSIEKDDIIVDCGSFTIENAKTILNGSDAVIANGPLGMYDFKGFENGTYDLISHICDRTKEGKLFSITGGGDINACLKMTKRSADISFVSTGGGAFIEYIESINGDKEMPAIEALKASYVKFDKSN